MAATAFISISHPFLSSSFVLKPNHQTSSDSCNSHPSISSPLKLVAPHLPFTTNLAYQCPHYAAAPLSSKRWKLSAHRGTLFLLDTTPLEENAQEIVSTTDGGASSIVSVLLFVAFVGLSVLTIGVIYIAVTDFLQKREREKFEKEEAAKKKNGKKGKIRTRTRTGPRGFGQKIEEEID